MTRKDITSVVAGLSKQAEEIVDALEKAGALNLTYGNEGIGKVTDAFKSSFNTTSISKWDRFAAGRLAKKHEADNVIQIIAIMAAAQGKPYCPSIASIRQLEEKWVLVGNWIKRNNTVEMNF